MDTFSYLSVLFSVVLGLALTQILQGLRTLMLARSRVVVYWPALIWTALMIIIIVQMWWSMFTMQALRDWTFAKYAVVMFQITALYLAVGVALPDAPPAGIVDMRKNYFSHARWFFCLLALTIASTLMKDVITVGHIVTGWNARYLGLFFVLSIIAALVRSKWYHALLAPFSLIVLLAYTALVS